MASQVGCHCCATPIRAISVYITYTVVESRLLWLERDAMDRGSDAVAASGGRKRKRSWYTAMFYFSEHIREASGGAINYKVLYSLVGTKGHYVNHANAAVRASTAPELSRLIHSSRYAEDLRRSHQENEAVFDAGAASLYTMLGNLTLMSDDEMFAKLSGVMWDDIAKGFANEKNQGRSELDLVRIEQEMGNMFSQYAVVAVDNRRQWLVSIISSYFHALGYGYIDVSLAHLLAADTITVLDDEVFEEELFIKGDACLIRVCDESTIGGIWRLDPDKETVIGRYTDCDITESAGFVSRMHCLIRREGMRWVLQDDCSKHGTAVVRGGETIVVRGRDSTVHGSVLLRQGDVLVLANQVRYWFGALRGDGEADVGSR